MRHLMGLALLGGALALPCSAHAQVFLNEVFLNPPASSDDFLEYIELLGTPGMKLDGYAIACVNGTDVRFVAPVPNPAPEIDEFFSLDGLSLGKNGILVIGIGLETNYPSLLPDSNFAHWKTLWNGGLGTPNKLQNDGANTLFLLRNRPGATQADPFHPLGAIWRKGALQDHEVVTNVLDPSDGQLKNTFGDGRLDEGQPDNFSGGFTQDFYGAFNGGEALEVVDEVSYESGEGWQYPVDERKVDVGSSSQPLPERFVHELGDPQGFDPDALSRVDYRTKGPGHLPTAGATGQQQNGRNWQDTATEQWIRGESVDAGGTSYYAVDANVDPNALQPFKTNVPLWLADGQGQDFAFAQHSYPIWAGRVNPLAVPFVPGDVDRDGACGEADLAKLRAVFADGDWSFGNAHASAVFGVDGDPATQTRPWDVDGNGDRTIGPSDLAWVLNFQGDTTGRIQGVTYDSPVPSSTGVHLGSNAAVVVSATWSATTSCGAPLSQLRVGDAVEVVVSAQVVAGQVSLAGRENGIQQFVHDVLVAQPGVLRVESVDTLFPFRTTREGIALPAGNQGDAGMTRLNGFATGATLGLAGATPLYRVVLRAIGAGSTAVLLQPSGGFADAPHGMKVAHTDHDGDPAASNYPSPLAVSVAAFTGAGSLQAYGSSCVAVGGYAPRLFGAGCPTAGGAIDLEVRNALGGATPFLFLGLGQGPIAVTPTCALQNLPLLTFAPVVLPPLAGVGPGAGTLLLPGLPIPAIAPVGASVSLQMLFSDPNEFIAATNPLLVTFGL